MKQEEKGFRNNFRSFKATAKKVSCSTKLPLYWSLVQECLEKNEENVDYVRDQWWAFNRPRLIKLEKKLGLK
jgi:hypothetical protein